LLYIDSGLCHVDMTSPAAFTPDVESPQSPANNMFGHLQTRPMRGTSLILLSLTHKTDTR